MSVEVVEFDAGSGRGEAPVDGAADGVAAGSPSAHFLTEGGMVGEAAVKAQRPESRSEVSVPPHHPHRGHRVSAPGQTETG